MLINIHNKNVELFNLGAGKVFVFQDKVYIYASESDKHNCINLHTGQREQINVLMYVTPVQNMTVTI